MAVMPDSRCSSTWQWNIHILTLSGTISGYELCRQQGKDVSAVSPDRNDVSVPVGRMDIHGASRGHHIPAHMISSLRYEHWYAAEHIAVDARPEIGRREAVTGTMKIPVDVAKGKLPFIYRLRFLGVRVNVVLEIVRLIFPPER
jgi:hypothetical protein